ncbi:MAG: response regulator, partial [Pseudomonadota bacterium]|nr:response regulator [Pseudomonadota bacterium]
MSHILIVEDEPVIRGALRKLLERHDHSVTEADSVEQARDNNLNQFDLIISDLRLPGEPGTTLIEIAGSTPVLIMTSYASLRSAVDAMRQGAVDYIPKPFDHDEMLIAVDRVLKEGRLNRGNRALRRDLERSYPVNNMVGSSEAMEELKHRISRVGPTNTPVLIMGEAGTGKE